MTIGIMAALHNEVAELIEKIKQQSQLQIHKIGMRDYYVGELEGQSCVVVLARCGKAAAAATTVSLIREFGELLLRLHYGERNFYPSPEWMSRHGPIGRHQVG